MAAPMALAVRSEPPRPRVVMCPAASLAMKPVTMGTTSAGMAEAK